VPDRVLAPLGGPEYGPGDRGVARLKKALPPIGLPIKRLPQLTAEIADTCRLGPAQQRHGCTGNMIGPQSSTPAPMTICPPRTHPVPVRRRS
jgi:hypothetical protein